MELHDYLLFSYVKLYVKFRVSFDFCIITKHYLYRRCRFIKRKGRKRTKCGRKRWKERHYKHREEYVNNTQNISSFIKHDELVNNRKYKFKIVPVSSFLDNAEL